MFLDIFHDGSSQWLVMI